MAENFAVENGVLTFGFSATKSLTTEIVSILSQKKKNSTLHWIKWPKKTFGLSCILLVKGRRKRLAFSKVSVTIVQSSPPVRYFEPPQYDWLLLRLISNQGVDSHPGDLLTKILRNKKHLMRILSRNLSAWKSVSAEPRPEQQFAPITAQCAGMRIYENCHWRMNYFRSQPAYWYWWMNEFLFSTSALFDCIHLWKQPMH